MVSKFIAKFSLVTLVVSTLAIGTGCSATTGSTFPATAQQPATTTSATQADSRIAHFDRQSLERTFF